MRRIVGALLVLMTLTGAAIVAPARATGAPLNIVFLGDSLTRGFAATTESQRYAELVVAGADAQYPAATFQLVDMSTYGISAAAVAASDPAIPAAAGVVIELGTNDYSGYGAPSPSSLADFHAAYASLVARAKAAAPYVFCLGIWQPDTPNSLGLTSADYDGVIQSLCPLYVPLQSIYDNGANHGPAGRATYLGPGDWFHPNDAGHAAIAAAVLAA